MDMDTLAEIYRTTRKVIAEMVPRMTRATVVIRPIVLLARATLVSAPFCDWHSQREKTVVSDRCKPLVKSEGSTGLCVVTTTGANPNWISSRLLFSSDLSKRLPPNPRNSVNSKTSWNASLLEHPSPKSNVSVQPSFPRRYSSTGSSSCPNEMSGAKMVFAPRLFRSYERTNGKAPEPSLSRTVRLGPMESAMYSAENSKRDSATNSLVTGSTNGNVALIPVEPVSLKKDG
mmetsp:Transcript_2876/g.6411  ORF Transcript_2876/g.6411 Transcript_2876/m.6411 type:complete len:231 (-) Transcript_2876:1751-2443(-)